MKTLMSGGDALRVEDVARMLAEAGFEDVRELPAPPSIPARMIVGRKPA